MPPKLGAPCAAGLVAQFSPSPRSSAEHPVSKSSGEVKNQSLPMSETVSCPISALTLHRFPARRKICKPSDVFGNLEKKNKKIYQQTAGSCSGFTNQADTPRIVFPLRISGSQPAEGAAEPAGADPKPCIVLMGQSHPAQRRTRKPSLRPPPGGGMRRHISQQD